MASVEFGGGVEREEGTPQKEGGERQFGGQTGKGAQSCRRKNTLLFHAVGRKTGELQ